jgi:hypothetical protein
MTGAIFITVSFCRLDVHDKKKQKTLQKVEYSKVVKDMEVGKL